MAQRSMYEILNGANSAGNPDLALNAANSDAVVEKQRFVWDFTPIRGNSTDAWTKIGSGTAAMDSNGFALTPSSGSMNISFGNKRPFDKRASRNIWITRYEKATAGSMYAGMWYNSGDAGEDHHTFWFRGDGVSLGTADGTQGFTSTSVEEGNTFKWGAWEIESLASSVNANINGKLNVTRTANLSRQHLQPMVWVWSGSTARMKYCEAYNT